MKKIAIIALLLAALSGTAFGQTPNGAYTSPSTASGSGTSGLLTVVAAKTASYPGVTGDFSTATTPPGYIPFAVTVENQTYILPATAPALVGACVVIENLPSSAPNYIQILTGGARTLDTVAYAAAPGWPLAPGQSMRICTDSAATNYVSERGNSAALPAFTNAVAPTWIPTFVGGNSNTPTTNLVPQVIKVVLHDYTPISKIQVWISTGQAGANCDFGIFDLNSAKLSAMGSTACTASGAIGGTATSSVILPPGPYFIAGCTTNNTVAWFGPINNAISAVMTNLGTSNFGTAANLCTAVTSALPANLGAITNNNAVQPPGLIVQ